VLLVSEAWAKRTSPKPVTPVIQNGVKYVAPNLSGRQGVVEARDEKTDKKLWDVVVYSVRLDRNLEEDVQWVFVTRLAVHDNNLVVTNEKNESFAVDLRTKKVQKLKDEKK
jgi:hypothetical protein